MAAKTLTIELDRTRTLKRSVRAIRLMHEATGHNFLSGQNPFQDAIIPGPPDEKGNPTGTVDLGKVATILPKVLWALLVHEDPTLTPDAVEEMVDTADVLPAMERVYELLSGAVFDGKTAQEPEAEPRGDEPVPFPAGSGSGQSAEPN